MARRWSRAERARFHAARHRAVAVAAFGLSLLFCRAEVNASAGGAADEPRASAVRPNIIFIMADDLSYGDLSSYGCTDYRTPHLDRLAEEGLRFTHAYAIAPLCSATRVGFMTGRYPGRTRVGLWEPLTGVGDENEGLPPDPPTLPLRLQRAGYHTALVGKWHLGWRPEFQPKQHGFEYSYGPLGGAIDYVSHETGSPDGRAARFPLPRPGSDEGDVHDLYRNGERAACDGYLTDCFTEEAVMFVRTARSPFFLSLQYTAPHWPWQRRGDPPYPKGKPWLHGSGSREIYADMVRAMDEGVGLLVQALTERGLADNTLIIFTSDNGGEGWANTGPLRGRKVQLWEGGIRVPAIVRWPGVVPAGVTDQVVTTLDWSATILAVAGVTPPAEYDGWDLLPFLRGEVPVRERTLFWRGDQRHRQRVVRSGAWKYVRVEPIGATDREMAGEHLFDVVKDPGETTDLKAAHPEVIARLRRDYDAWQAQMLPPIPLP